VLQPEDVNEPGAIEWTSSRNPDALVVAAFGQIFKQPFFRVFNDCILNVHASLLPKYRGPNPVAYAILNGDPFTGVSIMRIAEEIDAGPVFLQREIPVGMDDTTGSLTSKLSILGGEVLAEVLDMVEAGGAVPVPQDDALATGAPAFSKRDGLINWSLPAEALERRIRAMQPWPGAYTFLQPGGTRIAVISAPIGGRSGEPGKVLKVDEHGIHVGAGEGALVIERLQAAGKRVCMCCDFLRGTRVCEGDRFGS